MNDKSSNHALNTAIWKLSTAVMNIKTANLRLPTMVADTYNKVSNGKSIPEPMVLSAYTNSYTDQVNKIFPSLPKLIARLGFIRFELLSLLDTIGSHETNQGVVDTITSTLAMIPTMQTMAECEIRLAGIIHSLTHEELTIVKQQMYSKELYIKRGTVSNHVFTLIKLGRDATKNKKRSIVLKLIENQLLLWRELAYTGKKSPVSSKLQKELLQTAHWVPQSIEEAEELYVKSVSQLAAIYASRPAKPEPAIGYHVIFIEPETIAPAVLDLELVASDDWKTLAELAPKPTVKIIRTMVDTEHHLDVITNPKTIGINLIEV